MREVAFPLFDRLALVPVELVRWAKYAALIVIALLLLAGLGLDGYSWRRVASTGAFLWWAVSGNVRGEQYTRPGAAPVAARSGAVALKGACLGVLFVLGLAVFCLLNPGVLGSWPTMLGWGLLIPAVASFVTMSFVGSTTYTSLSGVRWEMRIAVPVQVLSAIVGLAFWIMGRFV